MTRRAWRFAVGHVVVVAIAAAVGWVFGHALLVVALTLAVMLGWQFAQLNRLDEWLRHRASRHPPNMNGLWGDVLATVSRIYRRKVFHKRRVLALLREFRRMTSAMPDGAILLGPSREIVWFNRVAGRWLGLRRRPDKGMRIDNLIRHPEFVEYMDSKGATPVPRLHLSKLGDRWLTFQLVTSEATSQQLVLIRDVTQEVRVEAMRKDFVANASHELRSPLTVISGYLDALVDEPSLDESWRGPVDEMRRQSDRMRGILQDLLELSRLEASGTEAERTPVDVAGMLALMRKDVLARPDRPSEVNLQLDSSDQLLGSEIELNSIFSNLVSNAVKFTPRDGRIDIRWWTDAEGGHVSVTDTGVGIPAEHLPRLTERFYRVDPGRSRSMGGSGLGLAIVKHALQRHGGRLEIQSVEGSGSTFTCHFPVARVQPRDA